MKIGKLRELIQDIPDGTVLVVSGSDHSYREADVVQTTAIKSYYGLSEDFGEDVTPVARREERIKVLLVN